ncbi:Uncharacterised protein [Vibrio cholerae]|nr:Uncharacterised protein [Vibrio cholerae]
MTHCLTQIRQVQKRLVSTRPTNLLESGALPDSIFSFNVLLNNEFIGFGFICWYI